jgi:MFS family permease
MTVSETAPPVGATRLRPLLPIFFASGFASLVYQVVWQKVLSQLIGVDTYSVTLIVSLFMLGLGFGGIVGGALTRRVRRVAVCTSGLKWRWVRGE